jgi:hypothetical protein
VSLGDAILLLTDIGVLPVLTLAAVIGLAVQLYRRFRNGGGIVPGPHYDQPGVWTEQDYYDFAMRRGQYED